MKFPAVAGGVTSDTPQSGRRCSCEMRISCRRIRKKKRSEVSWVETFTWRSYHRLCVYVYIYIYVYTVCIYICMCVCVCINYRKNMCVCVCNIYKYICEDGHLNVRSMDHWEILGTCTCQPCRPQRWIRGNSFGTTVDTCNMYSRQSPECITNVANVLISALSGQGPTKTLHFTRHHESLNQALVLEICTL